MNQAVKAAIFSALLFPGWGQVYLKNYKRGLAIILLWIISIVDAYLLGKKQMHDGSTGSPRQQYICHPQLVEG